MTTTATASHTAGPWRLLHGDVHTTATTANVVTVDNERKHIASVSFDGRWMSDGETVANAQLIAAAPDLLQGATAAWHLCQSLLAVREGATDDGIRTVANFLANAIARAEGRA